VYNAWATEGRAIGHAVVEEAHENAHVDLSPTINRLTIARERCVRPHSVNGLNSIILAPIFLNKLRVVLIKHIELI
jgi:hypothetical protein